MLCYLTVQVTPLNLFIAGDNTLRIWDISAPPHAQQTIRAHNGEVLTCDWAKYDPVSIIMYQGILDTTLLSGNTLSMIQWVYRQIYRYHTSFLSGNTLSIMIEWVYRQIYRYHTSFLAGNTLSMIQWVYQVIYRYHTSFLVGNTLSMIQWVYRQIYRYHTSFLGGNTLSIMIQWVDQVMYRYHTSFLGGNRPSVWSSEYVRGYTDTTLHF